MFGVDCCTAGAFVLDMDGRFDFGLFGHIQENVDLKTGIRRRRCQGRTSQNVLKQIVECGAQKHAEKKNYTQIDHTHFVATLGLKRAQHTENIKVSINSFFH